MTGACPPHATASHGQLLGYGQRPPRSFEAGGGVASPHTADRERTSAMTPSDEQAVLIHVMTPDAPDGFEIDMVEEPIVEAVDSADVGEYDGHEIGPDEVTFYLYGP